jgi:hypothetical protein
MAGRRVSVYLDDYAQCVLEVAGLPLRDVLRRGIEACAEELTGRDREALRAALLCRAEAGVDALMERKSSLAGAQ